MSKGLKSLYTLLGLISLTLLGFVAVISKQHIYLPSFNWLDWDFNLPSPINDQIKPMINTFLPKYISVYKLILFLTK